MASIRHKSRVFVSVAAVCALVASPLAMATASPLRPTLYPTPAVVAVDTVLQQNSRSASPQVAVQTALVDSCADPWYWRSGIEELTCGFSGQGWWN
ncbi:hypothetical protein [Burkholderia perseverans]|uniref:hypothetical protein n=1 Tax=Burkholderia perseverans TaxID=2615214 RepID=UPI001FED9994|nr:hypothetical protein [Burkholderia perseverans]